VKRGQAVIPLDDRDGPARAQHATQRGQRSHRILQVLEHEADEGVVERSSPEGQRHDIGLAQLDVAQAGSPHALRRSPQRLRRDVDAREACPEAARCERAGLGTDAATDLEDGAAGRVGDPAVYDLHQRACLVLEPLVLANAVPVNVRSRHGRQRASRPPSGLERY
jgi:hypothetical protein